MRTRLKQVTISACFGVALVGGCASVVLSQHTSKDAADDFKISTDVQLVLLDVSVKDAHGGYVSGLTKDKFTVFENGKRQPITQFASIDVPVTVGFVADNSGSMTPKRPEVVTAGLAFMQASNPKDEIFVVNFNEKVRRGLPDMLPFSDDVKKLRAALSKEKPEGRTKLYDAIAFALKHLEMGRRDKKTLVVVSDGGDNFSDLGLKDVINLVQESMATIYTIGIYSEDDPDKNPQVLKRLARISGGECFLPTDLKEVVGVCKQIAQDIRNRYTIAYVPPPPDEKHSLRTIKVTAATEGRGKMLVRTRTSYHLPYKASHTAAKETGQ